MSAVEKPGALLMTYGSPESLERDHIGAYLARVRGGREPGQELIDEFTRRYRVIGGSPLIDITRAQAVALSGAVGWPVEIGMRFSEPSIGRGLRDLAERGVSRVAAIVLSPQFSPLLMGGYASSIEEALPELGRRAPHVELAGAWHLEPRFVSALARRIREALAGMPDERRNDVAILMTAHSLPKRVADDEPAYLAQLRETAEGVATEAGIPSDRWQFCWQSAGHEPGEWMKPDFADLMPQLAKAGRRSVLVVPLQFLADHLELLYDVDIGARQQAELHGLAFGRIRALNTDRGLIAALANVAGSALPPVARATVQSPSPGGS